MTDLPIDSPTAKEWETMTPQERTRFAAGYLVYALDEWHDRPTLTVRVRKAIYLVRESLAVEEDT